jgi:hypothetical protein
VQVDCPPYDAENDHRGHTEAHENLLAVFFPEDFRREMFVRKETVFGRRRIVVG